MPRLCPSCVPATTVLLVLLLGPRPPAVAQVAGPLTPPVAEGSTEVPYPTGASGDAVVAVELLVEADGTVSSAEVIGGVEPFAEQARRAALTWKFTPARWKDSPVAARIRAHIEFHAPPAPLAPPPAPPAARPVAPLEVTVRGQRREIGQTTLSAADVREMPGAFGDPFRAIEPLPGVTPVISGLPYFYIRGAPPNDNGYFIDGIRVPLLFHVGLGEGVIHPALVDHVDVYPGESPARYGGSAGAILAGQTREPAVAPHGQANLRLIDAGGLVETPFAGNRGSVLLAGRYGYPGPILGALSSDIKLGYWDYQARLAWRLSGGGGGTLGLFAFGSHDYLGTSSRSGAIVEQLGSDFHRLDLRYDHGLGDDGHLRVAATVGYDSQGGAGGGDQAPPATITDVSAALRLEIERRLSRDLRLRGGAAAHLDRYGFAQGTLPPDPSGAVHLPVPASADPPPTNLTAGAHLDLVWHLGPRLELVPGVRADVFASSRSGGRARTTIPALDPRLSARVVVAPALAWITTVGLSHQYPALRAGAVPALAVTVPGFPLGSRQLQTALKASQGLEVTLPAELMLSATGFLAHWSGLTDLTANCFQVMPPSAPQTGAPEPFVCPDDGPVSGDAYGVELLVRKPLSRRLGGWLSYTLARSTRETHFVTLSGGDAVARVPSDFDRTHTLNAILTYALGRSWRAGARWVAYSGAPFSELAGNVPVPPYNEHRGPAFFRMDVRLEKRWTIGKSGSLTFVLEGQNVTLSREVSPLTLNCTGEPVGGVQTTQCSYGKFGPLVLPSVGIEASF